MPLSRTVLRRSYLAAVLLSVLGLSPMTWAWLTSSGHRAVADSSPGWLEDVPEAPVALVLGAGAPGGTPSPMLASRLDLSARLYRAGKVRAILLSGDNSRKDYDEPTVMRDYLVARGIPAKALVLDYAGFDTWDSCVRARTVFGATRATVVTQVFHLPRAVTLCRTAGIDAFGVGDDSAKRWATTYALAAREFFASAKGLLDSVVLSSAPVFPGPRETALEDALRPE
ncbi:vancomycin permeability regulator SanA [Streptosporangium becharense]|uniref:Vancomycin permeability regulator SanA n=1 Tax=Streptosporangium becharense TaxID=1816182 RepID=A0A7W9IC28_9ACTN|nr:ElyC/SanA/YdcF family protein [Streptosporangium becharense]MBB2915217.1 vancomycin permeability regulator SanA [Streptosporangium becharense]MBB5817954.1 vancomycin permeability regulator SanA [Streptosporangium becharense]